MRVNLPVTQVERELAPGEYIVSKTDLKGRITYVNRPFIEISGYSATELIGKAHNIIRHPDMPPEAFDDMWRTLQAGKAWRGLVKNRCKNGDHYWVEANANPIWENGQIVGYMSLRSRPSRAQIQAAEDFYRQLRESRANGLTVRNGQAARTGILGSLQRLTHWQLGTRISAALLGVALMVIWMAIQPNRPLAWTQPAVTLGLLSWLGWTVHRHILGQMRDMIRSCQSIASGSLTVT
ncbi:MAG TPA: PAS domain-containing protein, partial [Aquabacterium sp.]|nr:PAS domain-containing protein [Aquabacterium sp.]